MIPLYLILLGAYLFYTGSKYCPQFISLPTLKISRWLMLLPLILGAALFVAGYGWASGLLLWITACCLSISLVQLSASLGRGYFFTLVAFAHVLLLFDLFI